MARRSPLHEGGTDIEILGEDYSALILVEANLEVPPTFQLRRTDPNRRVAEFSNTLVNEDGERVQQHWRISVPEPYGLPGPFDQDVWVAVQTLVGMRGGMPPDGRLYFSLYEILGVMRKLRKGDNYKELRASLYRLAVPTSLMAYHRLDPWETFLLPPHRTMMYCGFVLMIRAFGVALGTQGGKDADLCRHPRGPEGSSERQAVGGLGRRDKGRA